MYWLKPFDCINDAANATALLQFDWSKSPIVEIGGGDGVFSFIMHGGRFNFLNDRYGQTDIYKKGDIYDVFNANDNLEISARASLRYDVGIDLKRSHLLKSAQTGMYKYLISSLPETLSLKKNYFGTVFLYIFHGLTDYDKTLAEIRGAMKNDGTLLMIAVNDSVKSNFVCFNLYKYFKKMNLNRLSDYFFRLDSGRHDEIGDIFSKSPEEWKLLLEKNRFRVEAFSSQVSPFLWRIYDTQTRPFLNVLIRFDHMLEILRLKAVFKMVWMCAWFPLVLLSYHFLARPKKTSDSKDCTGVFLAIKATPF